LIVFTGFIPASTFRGLVMKRRHLLATGALAAPFALTSARPAAAAAAGTLKVGYQKSSTALVLLKSRGWIEGKLAPLGYDVTWAEFPSGPPMLEALAAGAVNLAFTGETPPIFSQASGTPVVYVANSVPHPHQEAVLVPASSTITSVAGLKGKQVAVAKGSSSHYLLVAAVAKAGLAFSDIKPVYLAPSDARAAFQSGNVDAWAIWDPFFAAAQAAGAKILTDAAGLVPNHDFYLSRRDFATANAPALEAVITEVAAIESWIPNNRAAAATEIAATVGLPQPILLASFNRATYGVQKITPSVLADEQKVADTFYKLGLIPSPVNVAAASWS
jgi:sulfonate transport system substrate-binding protein